MLWTIGQLLSLISDSLPEGMISDRAWRRIQALPDNVLPRAFTAGCFECRLEEDATRVDFTTCIDESSGGQGVLADSLADPGARGQYEAAGWGAAWRFLSAWTHPGSPVKAAVDTAWLEFDLDSDSLPAKPFPAFRLRSGGERNLSEHPDQSLFLMAGLVAGLGLTRGAQLPATHVAILKRCMCAVPKSGRLLHAGSRADDHDGPVRIIVALPATELPSYLEGVGWPGTGPALDRVLGAASSYNHRINLHLDLNLNLDRDSNPASGGHPFASQIGIEVFQVHSQKSAHNLGPLLEFLESESAITPVGTKACRAWGGRQRGQSPFVIHARESALKILYEPTSPLRAKVYFGFRSQMALAMKGAITKVSS